MKMQYSTDWQQYLTQDVVDEMVSLNLNLMCRLSKFNGLLCFIECHSGILQASTELSDIQRSLERGLTLHQQVQSKSDQIQVLSRALRN